MELFMKKRAEESRFYGNFCCRNGPYVFMAPKLSATKIKLQFTKKILK